MKSNYYILIIEDEAPVRDAVLRDVEKFENYFPVEAVQSAEEAEELIAAIQNEGGKIALILCDHLLPVKNGVDFLIESMQFPITRHAKKVLVTGQAGHQDTINAVNNAGLDFYVSKPWKTEDFQQVVKKQLTDFVLKEPGLDPIPYMGILDGAKIMDHIRNSGLAADS
ncbi:response regulator [bacterium]|nr:MAG: response regulator [bacterium]